MFPWLVDELLERFHHFLAFESRLNADFKPRVWLNLAWTVLTPFCLIFHSNGPRLLCNLAKIYFLAWEENSSCIDLQDPVNC